MDKRASGKRVSISAYRAVESARDSDLESFSPWLFPRIGFLVVQLDRWSFDDCGGQTFYWHIQVPQRIPSDMFRLFERVCCAPGAGQCEQPVDRRSVGERDHLFLGREKRCGRLASRTYRAWRARCQGRSLRLRSRSSRGRSQLPSLLRHKGVPDGRGDGRRGCGGRSSAQYDHL
jgi:hypothetical protein